MFSLFQENNSLVLVHRMKTLSGVNVDIDYIFTETHLNTTVKAAGFESKLEPVPLTGSNIFVIYDNTCMKTN